MGPDASENEVPIQGGGFENPCKVIYGMVLYVMDINQQEEN